MFDQIVTITNFIVSAFLHIWPYLLVTIPLSVVVRMSGASKYISRAFQARPITAIFLATAIGAFSPLCSCGVIPVVAALLIGGVPVAPVMSFWIASPSMDPEIFFLSVATLGWELAVWRLAGTLVLSLSAGFATHFIERRGWLGQQILRSQQAASQSTWELLKNGWRRLAHSLTASPQLVFAAGGAASASQVACCIASAELVGNWQPVVEVVGSSCGAGSCSTVSDGCSTSCSPAKDCTCSAEPASFWGRLLKETGDATLMVVKFMTLAFFLEALIEMYIPQEWIAGLVGHQNPMAILSAALLGVPIYTGNMAALPMVSGLLAQGMNPAAALAFLIAGPTTTLPAMSAVWGIVSRRVFALYVSLSLVGAILLGYSFSLVKFLI
jgi:hypothetical protein